MWIALAVIAGAIIGGGVVYVAIVLWFAGAFRR